MRQLFLLLILCVYVFTAAYAQQMVTEVIPLAYRSMHEIIPLIRPLVSPSGSVTGLQGQLVVTATPRQLTEVRKILGALDSSPVRLLISVRRGKTRTGSSGSASVQGNAGNIAINNGVTADLPADSRQSDRDYLSLRMKAQQLTEEENITQQVQVLEGREAYISAGEEIPVRNRGVAVAPGGVYQYNSTEFYPAVTGFYAIPRLNGDEVYLEINTVSRQRDNVKINGYYPRQNISVSNISTSVTGKLGDWLVIGNVDQSGASRNRGIAAMSRQQQDASSLISVRVEKIQSGE